ncbi:MAG: right-handed parallel beta-helix repeat-containing protein [Kiritimatiellaeota bacterium]|nr:right-handed parallel beta-helix repeat-containing protein [Kiritimatiellota bacterium]
MKPILMQRLAALLALGLCAPLCGGAELFVSPTGDDAAVGTQAAPFRTMQRAQAAARALIKDMRSDVVVNLAPGDYRLDRTLVFTNADSGRNGFRVIYRSAAGPGQARLLGSKVLTGWQPCSNGIWKVDLPPKTIFHTLYENGQRVHKARFPDLEVNPDMPTALDRYLVTVAGSPIQSDKTHERVKGPGWLEFRPEDLPPVTTPTKMRIHLFARGKCDWVREIQSVVTIDAQSNRLTLASTPSFGIGAKARFFLEDELGFLNKPGEFFVDEKAHTLFYMPLGQGHPDKLGIAYPVISRMLQLQGASREQCVERLVFDGLALEETDCNPPLALWAYDGKRDGALVWLNNTAHVELRNCHLKNGGRSGVMLIGHNTDNLVTGCWIEHMGLNGVSLCNWFLALDKKSPTADRCEGNRIHNTHISHIGELHTYAECVTIFNVSRNEVDHCQLDNSVRYALTLRGNTGEQYGPLVSTAFPPTAGNRFHHLRIERCGQDGGDMGALHCAALNNPGGGSTNTFEQITVVDTRAVPSVKDIAPDGIFLDWPKMSMDQTFRNVQIARSQGRQLRSHKPENGDSATTENVSWKPGFRPELMDYANIGLTADFPAAYGGRPAPVPVPVEPPDPPLPAPKPAKK